MIGLPWVLTLMIYNDVCFRYALYAPISEHANRKAAFHCLVRDEMVVYKFQVLNLPLEYSVSRISSRTSKVCWTKLRTSATL